MAFKRVAILCPGPSLEMFADVDVFYHDTIGVGPSVGRFSCRWWCFGSAQVYREVRTIGRPLLFVPQAVAQPLARDCPRLAREVVVHQESIEFPLSRGPAPQQSDGLRWNRYGGLAALALAWHLEADLVDVYGCDLAGNRDFLGQIDPDRSDDRWRRERLLMEQMTSVFTAARRRVARVLPPRRLATRAGEPR